MLGRVNYSHTEQNRDMPGSLCENTNTPEEQNAVKKPLGAEEPTEMSKMSLARRLDCVSIIILVQELRQQILF